MTERRARGADFVAKEASAPADGRQSISPTSLHELTERQLEASSAELSYLFSTFRVRLVLLLVFTVGAGFVLAGLSLWRILGLERDGEVRFQQILGAQKELKRLSAELLAAQENERRRISRELHDEVGEVLSAIMLESGESSFRDRERRYGRGALSVAAGAGHDAA